MKLVLDTNVLIAAFISHGTCNELYERLRLFVPFRPQKNRLNIWSIQRNVNPALKLVAIRSLDLRTNG
jgi:hypothetical protein